MSDQAAKPMTPAPAQRSHLSSRTLSALLWTFSGSGVQSALRVVTVIILARLLTPADFGVVAAALTVVQFSEIFALLGVGPALVQRADLEERHLRTGFTFSIVFGVALAGLLWILTPTIAGFFRSEQLIPVLHAIILVFPFAGLTVVAESLMQRELHFRKLATIEVAAYAVGSGLVGISLAVMGFGIWSLVLGYVVQRVLKGIALLAGHPHPKRPQFEVRAFRELIYFGGGLTIARIFNYLGVNGDNLVVGRWLGLEALGFYGRAYSLMTIFVSLLGSVLEKVLFPVMSAVQNEPERLQKAYARGTALIGLIILPLSASAWILAPEVIDVLLGPKWSAVIIPFRILVIGMLFRTSYKMSVSVARAKGAIYKNAWRQGIYAGLILGGAWLGQHWNLPGVALGVLFALGVHFALMTQFGMGLVQFTWRQFWRMHVPGMWCALIASSVIWGSATLLRGWQFAPLSTLVICAIAAPTAILGLAYLAPASILGPNGLWFLRLLLERVPGNVFVFVWLKKRVQEAAGATH